MRRLVLQALSLALASSPANLAAQGNELERLITGGVMGTEYHLTAIGPDGALLDRSLQAAITELRRIEDLMTDWRASPLLTLNAAAGKGPQVVPLELAQLISRGKALGELTDGAFDVTFAGVGKLWNFKKKGSVVPGAGAVKQALTNVDYRRIEIVPEKSSVALPAGFRIGLGGIAKGYGIDAAMRVLRQHGVRNALVNVGGDMKVLGKKHGQPWEVRIAHPRNRETGLALLRLSNTCVVTSGDYERFFEVDGVRYHHILDPRTGYPSKGCITATVVAKNAEYADSLATALCVMGPQKGLELVEKLRRVEAIVVGLDGKVTASTGLVGSLVTKK